MSVFITLEGPDGAGKSTQIELLAARIRVTGREVLTTREPGGTELGERIRNLVLATSDEHDAIADALLFNAARRRLVRDVIQPALERGAVVLCDRFADSTLAYQGYGSGAPLESLRQIAEAATGGLTPVRTVLLDVAAADGLARRMDGDQSALTKFETGSMFGTEFHERVRSGFLALAATEPLRWRVIDAARAPDQVADDVWEAVADLF